MRLVLFDIDGTLIEGASSEVRFAAWLLRRGQLGPAPLGAYLWFFIRYGARYGAAVRQKNKAYLRGMAVDQAAALAGEFVPRELMQALHPPAIRCLREHLAAGDIVALLSGTPQFIATPLARALAVPHAWATRCATRAGRFTAEPPSQHPFGAEKARLAAALAERFAIPLADTIAYTDSLSDLPLLKRVGRPVVVQAGRSLARIARQRGWEALSNGVT